MEETNNTTPTNAGKGMGVAGFVISLVALVIYFIVAPMAGLAAFAGGGMGLSIFWTILSVVGLVLSIMGFMKAKSGGGKKGLAIAGLVIGIVATIMSVRLVFAVKEIHATVGDAGKELIEKMGEGMKEVLDSAKNTIIDAVADSLKSH